MDNSKSTTSINVLDKIKVHAKQNPDIKSLSEFLNKKYVEEYMSIEKAKQDLIVLQNQVQLQKQEIKKLERFLNKIDIPLPAKKWIKAEAPKRCEKFEIESVLRYFNSKFSLCLNLHQFRVFMSRFNNKPKV